MNTELFTMNHDGSGIKQLTHTAEGINDHQASWSADGASIAFSRDTGPFHEIWIMDHDGGEQRRLTTGFFDGYPRFSPDGRYISFSRSTVGVCVIGRDGGGLVNASGPAYNVGSWLPTGLRIVYDDGAGNNFSANPDGSDSQAIFTAAGEVREPVWSHDGRRVAFLRENGSSHFDLWVMDSLGTNQVKLTDVPTFPPDNCQTPSWSPDGEKIVFTSEGIGIYVINPDGAGMTMILGGILGSACYQGKPR
ncbi:MAG: hypothetical protein MUC76_08720 [Spirochaetes bacterium]|nr:hypothetical protein [Spirochaetota bacterium]